MYMHSFISVFTIRPCSISIFLSGYGSTYQNACLQRRCPHMVQCAFFHENIFCRRASEKRDAVANLKVASYQRRILSIRCSPFILSGPEIIKNVMLNVAENNFFSAHIC